MNYFIQFLIVFDLICFGVYFGGDIICTALAKVRKKPGQKDPYEFEVEDEPAEPPLSIDAIRHLFRGEVRDFVCNKLLPSGQETLSALTEPEQTAARFLFCALIGYLKEEAPMDEQSFPMVMEMLNYAEGAKEDGDKDVIDILMEETAARTRQREEYFSDYRRYQLMQVDKARVLLACRVIINDLLGKLYRYDYNVGYDCLLDDGRAASTCLPRPARWWANAPAAAVRLQKCKKASSARTNLAILQSGRITTGGQRSASSPPRPLWRRC